MSIISVSKLCCPVCWDLLTFMRGKVKQHLMVRGRHPVLSPVQLPLWVPSDILTLMTERYENLLLLEVIKMMAPVDAYDNSDIESNAGFSSDGSEETASSMSNSWPSFQPEIAKTPSESTTPTLTTPTPLTRTPTGW